MHFYKIRHIFVTHTIAKSSIDSTKNTPSLNLPPSRGGRILKLEGLGPLRIRHEKIRNRSRSQIFVKIRFGSALDPKNIFVS